MTFAGPAAPKYSFLDPQINAIVRTAKKKAEIAGGDLGL